MTRDEAEGRGAVLLALASLLALALALSLGLGCATGYAAHEDGNLVLYAACIGEGAVLEVCVPVGEAGIVTAAPLKCAKCEGGPLLPSLLDGAGAVISTVGKVLWGWVGL